MTQLAAERRDRTRDELMSLIQDRNEMLALYCTLAGAGKNDHLHNPEDVEPELLKEFCENLIDYLARGQFELYQRITDGNERRLDIITLANEIYPRIAETTTIAVEFNDNFDKSGGNPVNFDHFDERLSDLGEELAIRFELEDRLINSLLKPKPAIKEAANA